MKLARSLFALCCISPMTLADPIFDDGNNLLTVGGWLGISLINSESDTFLADASSRMNFHFHRNMGEGWKVEAKAEWGFNTIDHTTSLAFRGDSLQSQREGDFFFNRQGWVGVSHQGYGRLTAGKQWSIYYDVTEITDYFVTTGGLASGVYNFGTDGGISGTGRADSAIIYRKSWGAFTLGLQYQANVDNLIEVVPQECIDNPEQPFCQDNNFNINYDDTYGIAALYHWQQWQFGIAFNTGEYTPEDSRISADNDDALAFSAKYGTLYDKGLHLAAVYAHTQRHEIDDMGRIFDGDGYELMLTYTLENQLTLVSGLNWLESNNSEYNNANGEFRRRFYVLGLHYLWNNMALVYLEAKLDDSSIGFDNLDEENAYGVGMRVYF
ncbi:porin [Ferrimonas aestuarii]|uniref:Porin n=1 Tax=Ferrimonas aestuarii TaxID=2569539 RepID=A0A4U1BSF1_9GAMM|nr:porin [Ferrimonas aestuarii]TKB56547.1 porin [Ferrimonas aestuarii]